MYLPNGERIWSCGLGGNFLLNEKRKQRNLAQKANCSNADLCGRLVGDKVNQDPVLDPGKRAV